MGSTAKVSDLSKEFVEKLLQQTSVETNIAFDANDTISLIVLDTADNLMESLEMHNVEARIGIVYNYKRNYPGWLLIVETENIQGSINPFVAKFFNWERIETQNILSFNEFFEN